MATSWGRHTRQEGLTWLSAGFMSPQKQTLRCGWLTAGPGAKVCSSSGRNCSQAIAVVCFPPMLLKMPPPGPFLVYDRSKSRATHTSTKPLTRVSRARRNPVEFGKAPAACARMLLRRLCQYGGPNQPVHQADSSLVQPRCAGQHLIACNRRVHSI
jgi:hypothetical protein